MILTVYGTRGSVPVSGREYREFGCATSCYLLEAGGSTLVLDAGSGIRAIPPQTFGNESVTVLLSHTHMDHVIGLPFFAPLFEKGREINVITASRGGLSAAGQIEKLFSPPLWPVGIYDYPASVKCTDASFPVCVGPFRIDGIASPHPGGSTVFRIVCGEKKIVYATDFEHTEIGTRLLTEFAENADLLLYDGQYTEEEYEKKRGFGHSTPREGMRVFENSGSKRMLIIHHDPGNNDDTLKKAENGIKTKFVRFAREGDVIRL